MLSTVASDSANLALPVGGTLIFLTMLKMIWTVYTNGSKAEETLRKSFADERVTRELEYTASSAKLKQDYSDAVIRHQEIYSAEVAILQKRITNYIDELQEMKERVSRLEEEVKELRLR